MLSGVAGPPPAVSPACSLLHESPTAAVIDRSLAEAGAPPAGCVAPGEAREGGGGVPIDADEIGRVIRLQPGQFSLDPPWSPRSACLRDVVSGVDQEPIALVIIGQPVRRGRGVQFVACQSCPRGCLWTRLLFWRGGEAGWNEFLGRLSPGMRVAVNGGVWRPRHECFGLAVTPATPAVAAVEWQCEGRWRIDFGVPLMVCSFACLASIPRTPSLWSRLEGAVRGLADVPMVCRLNVASKPVRSVAVGLRVRAGQQECSLPAGAREIVAAAIPLLLLAHPGAVVQALLINFVFQLRRTQTVATMELVMLARSGSLRVGRCGCRMVMGLRC